VPRFVVYRLKQRIVAPDGLKYPMVVKSVAEEASLGITQASVVSNEQRLRERVEFMRESYGVDVIVEEYIHGRELYVGVIGNSRLISYPVWELPFEHLGDGALPIATEKLKWDVSFQKRHKIATHRAQGLGSALERRIARMCKQIYKVLGVTGYARIDLRLSDAGEVYVLEANPNPDLKYGEDFAESAEAYGHSYADLLDRIVQLGLGYSGQWRRRARA
jgi:D-alanine-D-alanine ligase